MFELPVAAGVHHTARCLTSGRVSCRAGIDVAGDAMASPRCGRLSELMRILDLDSTSTSDEQPRQVCLTRGLTHNRRRWRFAARSGCCLCGEAESPRVCGPARSSVTAGTLAGAVIDLGSMAAGVDATVTVPSPRTRLPQVGETEGGGRSWMESAHHLDGWN